MTPFWMASWTPRRLLVSAVLLALVTLIYEVAFAMGLVTGIAALEVSRRLWDRSRVLSVLVLAAGTALAIALLELLS